jgi:hypothetical protein
MFLHSVSWYNVKYVNYLEDGGQKPFQAVQEVESHEDDVTEIRDSGHKTPTADEIRARKKLSNGKQLVYKNKDTK